MKDKEQQIVEALDKLTELELYVNFVKENHPQIHDEAESYAINEVMAGGEIS